MSRVITFSRYFPSYHPKAGQPTYFIKKLHYSIWGQIDDKWMDAQAMIYDLNKHLPRNIVLDFVESLQMEVDFSDMEKSHTIRGGHRFKAGDFFKPVVWGNDINPKSGRSGPYHSKQIRIAPDILVKKDWDFNISESDGKFFINQSPFTSRGMLVTELAKNDGLEVDDLKAWFRHPASFDGQIICWNDKIEY